MTRRTSVVVTATFNERQAEILRGLDALYGDTLEEKVATVVLLWLNDNATNIQGTEIL